MAGRYWSTAEVAELLGVTRQAVHKMWKRGELAGAQQLSGSNSSVIIPSTVLTQMLLERAKDLEQELQKVRDALEEVQAA